MDSSASGHVGYPLFVLLNLFQTLRCLLPVTLILDTGYRTVKIQFDWNYLNSFRGVCKSKFNRHPCFSIRVVFTQTMAVQEYMSTPFGLKLVTTFTKIRTIVLV